MKASMSYALLFCLLGNGLPALAATAEAHAAAPLEHFPAGDEAISLLQVDLHASASATQEKKALPTIKLEKKTGCTSGCGPLPQAERDEPKDAPPRPRKGRQAEDGEVEDEPKEAPAKIKMAAPQEAMAMTRSRGRGAADLLEAEAAAPTTPAFNLKASVAEFIAMTLFVFVGCGSAMSIAKAPGSAWVLQVALTFGLAITVLAYAIGHYSGGQINCAVTLGQVIVGNITVVQGIGNLVAQLLGSTLGAALLWLVYSGMPATSLDMTGGLGTNTLGEGVPTMSALIGEIMGTFVLVYVVCETADNVENTTIGSMAPLAIGFAVFLAHSVLICVDGCSINPTRSFGPAIVNAMMNPKSDGKALQQLWIFWVGPLIGAAMAAGVYLGMSA